MKRFFILALVMALGAVCFMRIIPSNPSKAAQTPANAPQSSPPASVPAARHAEAPGFNLQVIADRLTAPWAIAFLPDGTILFTERSGKVRLIENGNLVAEPALVVPDIKAWVKLGLLGLAIDPEFSANHFVYLAEGYGAANAERDSWVRVVRYELAEKKLINPRMLIDHIPAFLNHAGGRLMFAPDKTLFITTGDADRPPEAQNLNSLSGKILRINRDGTMPADNPFVNRSDAHPAIWSYGHRNPQGLAFQASTGFLFAPEHGPNGGDEINRIERGGNYGWPTISHQRSAPGMLLPLAEYSPSIAPAAAVFYHGAMFPELEGKLLVGCLRGETILCVTLDEKGERITGAQRLLHHVRGRIREVAVAPDGALWITTSEIDPPEGRNTDAYDQIVRLTRGSVSESQLLLPDENSVLKPVGGVALYQAHCASCHGQTAQAAVNSSLFDRNWSAGGRDNEIRRNIADGLIAQGMPAYADKLTPAEIDELVRFIRVREDSMR